MHFNGSDGISMISIDIIVIVRLQLKSIEIIECQRLKSLGVHRLEIQFFRIADQDVTI